MEGKICDGDYEPEEDPEEWIDGVADEVEEKRLQKTQVLEEPEGSAKGTSCLTPRNVYGWREETISAWGWYFRKREKEHFHRRYVKDAFFKFHRRSH